MLCIVNPISGNGRKAKIISLLEKSGLNVVPTEYPGHAEVLARETSERVVVAVGGDGTVNEVARGLIGTDKILGIIPCGSGDGLALDLNISRNPRQALQTLLDGNTVSMDAASVNGKYFFSVCGVGFDAQVSKMFADSGTRGLCNYVWQAIKLWHSFSPEQYKILGKFQSVGEWCQGDSSCQCFGRYS